MQITIILFNLQYFAGSVAKPAGPRKALTKPDYALECAPRYRFKFAHPSNIFFKTHLWVRFAHPNEAMLRPIIPSNSTTNDSSMQNI